MLFQGKSALWSHLTSFLELEECKQGNRYLDPNLLSPGKLASTNYKDKL